MRSAPAESPTFGVDVRGKLRSESRTAGVSGRRALVIPIGGLGSVFAAGLVGLLSVAPVPNFSGPLLEDVVGVRVWQARVRRKI
jgi:hypothetical protein